jgi:hypothetical protein
MCCAACGRVGFADGDDAAIAASLEPEAGVITPNFEVVADPLASGAGYVADRNADGVVGAGSAEISFTLAAPATYYFWGRTISTSQATDSFFMALDVTTPLPWDTSECDEGPDYHWVQLRTFTANCPAIGARLAIDLTAGAHQLVLTSREGGAIVDRIILTADPSYVPAD